VSEQRFLLDTQIVLWDLGDDPRIKPRHDEILLDDYPKFLSVASLWEIALKVRKKKLVVPDNLLDILSASDVQLLPIAPEHALHVATLPDFHGDPFDLLIIAQAQIEKMTLVTADSHITRYDVRTL
jgi:PIN domain nuclease of toxin-antitoxin system